MHRRIPLLVVVLLAVLVALVAPSAAQATQTCSDSWAADGHSGPWYTNSNQTLHGNSLKISCPASNVSWSVTYYVWKTSGGTAVDMISKHVTGSGNDQFSVSTSPVGCSSGWNYYTQVANNFTGGSISKPSDHTNVIC